MSIIETIIKGVIYLVIACVVIFFCIYIFGFLVRVIPIIFAGLVVIFALMLAKEWLSKEDQSK